MVSPFGEEQTLSEDANKFGATLPREGFVRLSQILGPGNPLPISKSTWWEGVKKGRFPKPVKLGPNVTAWRAQDIRKLLDELAA